jgi:hypothetical protein
MQWITSLSVVALAGVFTAVVADPEYVALDRDATALKADFNAAAGKVRVMAYVAPTCGGCLRGVDQMQKHVLPQLETDELEIFVVWVKKNGASERHVDRVTRLMTDPRATHYWDEHRVVVAALDGLLGIPDRACAGAFLVYGPRAKWTEPRPPSPAYWSDAHAGQFEDHGSPFDTDALTAAVRKHLK